MSIKEMKTLTINGVTYDIVDDDAMKYVDDTVNALTENGQIGGEIITFEEVAAEQAVNTQTDSELGVALGYLDALGYLEVGKEYIVTFDGVRYNCVCADMNGVAFMGNLAIFGAEPDTGEPFNIADVSDPAESPSYQVVTKIAGEHTFSIYAKTETVKSINPIYLPEDGFGYTSTEFGYIVPEIKIAITDGQSILSGYFGLTEGQEYIVNWNGTEYTCIAKKGLMGDVMFIYLGNFYIATQDESNNTGEPFILGDVVNNDGCGIMTASGDGQYTISIKGAVDTIHTIDPKYLPEGGVGYTEGEVAIILKEQQIEIAANGEANSAIIAKSFPINGEDLIIVWDGVKHICKSQYLPNENAYAYQFDTVAVLYAPDESTLAFVGDSSTVGTHMVAIYKDSVVIHDINPKYLPKGGFGYEDKRVVAYNGNMEDRLVYQIDNGLYVVKISDETPDSSELKSITFKGAIGTRTIGIEDLEITIDEPEAGANYGYYVGYDGLNYVYIIYIASGNFPSTGTYILHVTPESEHLGMENYVSEIDFGIETHTIDPMYLPDGIATEEYVTEQIAAVDIPSALADLTDDETHRTVTDAEKEAWNTKSDFSGSYNDLLDKPEALLYTSQSLTSEQKAQARENIGAMWDQPENLSSQIEFLHSDNCTLQVKDFWRVGKFCFFCLQFIVNTEISGDYGFNIATLPATSVHRVWVNYQTQFYIDSGTSTIRVNASKLATGNYMLNGCFISV